MPEAADATLASSSASAPPAADGARGVSTINVNPVQPALLTDPVIMSAIQGMFQSALSTETGQNFAMQLGEAIRRQRENP